MTTLDDMHKPELLAYAKKIEAEQAKQAKLTSIRIPLFAAWMTLTLILLAFLGRQWAYSAPADGSTAVGMLIAFILLGLLWLTWHDFGLNRHVEKMISVAAAIVLLFAVGGSAAAWGDLLDPESAAWGLGLIVYIVIVVTGGTFILLGITRIRQAFTRKTP